MMWHRPRRGRTGAGRRRGHYELAVDGPRAERVAAAFTEFARAIRSRVDRPPTTPSIRQRNGALVMLFRPVCVTTGWQGGAPAPTGARGSCGA
jgi:hypothetical protein